MIKDECESLSALMDNGPGTWQDENFLKKIGDDVELGRTWRRYHLIGESLRHNLSAITDRNFPDRIMACIAKEPLVFAPKALSSSPRIFARNFEIPPWSKRIMGMAVAATVATMVFTLLLVNQDPGQSSAPTELAAVPKSIPSQNAPSLNPPSQSTLEQQFAEGIAGQGIIFDSVMLPGGKAAQNTLTHPNTFAGTEVSGGLSGQNLPQPRLVDFDQYVLAHSASVSLHSTLPYARMMGYLAEK